MSHTSDEDDAEYNPAQAYSNEDSGQQASRSSGEAADTNQQEGEGDDYEPHSPEYMPPRSPSEENSREQPVVHKKRRIVDSDDDDEEEGPKSPDADEGNAVEDEEVEAQTEEVVDSQEDDDGDDKKEHDVGDIIADIFGEDEEDEEFKGFKEAEEKGSSDDSSDVDVRRPKLKVKFSDKRRDVNDETSKTSDEAGPSFNLGIGAESDFDKLLNKRREEQRRRRKRARGMRSGAKIISIGSLDAEEREALEAGVDDIVQDADEIAVQLVQKMAKAAEEDREVCQKGELACKKLLLLPEAVDLISNVDFQPSMFDNGILGAITDWLLPLPDGSLPNIKIRTELLRVIQQFPSLNNDQLKDSGLGKAIMILCKHPKEIRANKTIARKLINEWARGIFGLSTQPNLEEREQQDLERLHEKKQRRLSNTQEPSTSQPAAKRPGDPGWIYRARVPQLSSKDYVVKPEWKITEAPKAARKEVSRYEKHARNLKERVAAKQKRHAAPSFIQFSIEGRKVL